MTMAPPLLNRSPGKPGMTIDINHLSIEELEMLNERIVRRLQFLDGVRAQQTMMALNIGNRVHFNSGRHGQIFATVIKFNQKTVSVISDE